MNSLHLGKEVRKLDYMLKCIPLKGSCSCCSRGKCNRKFNPNWSCYRGMICSTVVFHLIFQKYIFL